MKRIRDRASASCSPVEAYNGRLAAANQDHEKRSPLRSRASSTISAAGTWSWGDDEKNQYRSIGGNRSAQLPWYGCDNWLPGRDSISRVAHVRLGQKWITQGPSTSISLDNANPSDMFFDVFRCLGMA
jgi:hypothetical protein